MDYNEVDKFITAHGANNINTIGFTFQNLEDFDDYEQAQDAFAHLYHDPNRGKWAKMAKEIGLQGYTMDQVQDAVSLVAKNELRIGVDGKVRDTQKVKGIKALKYMGDFGNLTPPLIYQTLPTSKSISTIDWLDGVFVRPCPSTPKHGWIDSRKVYSQEDAYKMAMKVWNKDRYGQIMFMPAYTGKWSAVITETSISIGAGHDGATSNESMSLPVPTEFRHDIREKADISIEEGCYLEVVENKLHSPRAVMVQLRAGPKTAAGDVYIPEGFTYQSFSVQTLFPEDIIDLINWDHAVSNSSHNVYIMPGRSLSSHYAVHAILNGKLVIAGETATEVFSDYHRMSTEQINDNIELIIAATENDEVEPHDMAVIKASYNEWLHEKLPKEWLTFSAINGVAFLHSLPFMDGKHDRILGAALAWTVQAMAASCVGEGRHWSKNIHTIDRSSVHEAVWGDAPKYVELLKMWADTSFFNNAGWANAKLVDIDDEDGNYPELTDDKGNTMYMADIGGWNWQEAVNLVVKLHNAIDAGEEYNAFAAWNHCANAMHNGNRTVIGKTSTMNMDHIDTRQGAFVANPLTAYALGIIGIENKYNAVIKDTSVEIHTDIMYNWMGRDNKGNLKPANISFTGERWKENEKIINPSWITSDRVKMESEYNLFRMKHDVYFTEANDAKDLSYSVDEAWNEAAKMSYVPYQLDEAWKHAISTTGWSHSNWYEGQMPLTVEDDEDSFIWNEEDDPDALDNEEPAF